MQSKWNVLNLKFKNERGLRKGLFFDANFDTSLASLDPDYEERAIFLHQTQSKLVSLFLVSAVDLAVSKLSRFEINDRFGLGRR